MTDKTKDIVKKVGFGAIVVGGILAIVGGATLDEVKNGGVIAFGIVEVVGGAIAYIFGKK